VVIPWTVWEEERLLACVRDHGVRLLALTKAVPERTFDEMIDKLSQRPHEIKRLGSSAVVRCALFGFVCAAQKTHLVAVQGPQKGAWAAEEELLLEWCLLECGEISKSKLQEAVPTRAWPQITSKLHSMRRWGHLPGNVMSPTGRVRVLWTPAEVGRLTVAVKKHGRHNTRKLAKAVKTRTEKQVGLFAGGIALWYYSSMNLLLLGQVYSKLRSMRGPSAASTGPVRAQKRKAGDADQDRPQHGGPPRPAKKQRTAAAGPVGAWQLASCSDKQQLEQTVDAAPLPALDEEDLERGRPCGFGDSDAVIVSV